MKMTIVTLKDILILSAIICFMMIAMCFATMNVMCSMGSMTMKTLEIFRDNWVLVYLSMTALLTLILSFMRVKEKD